MIRKVMQFGFLECTFNLIKMLKFCIILYFGLHIEKTSNSIILTRILLLRQMLDGDV